MSSTTTVAAAPSLSLRSTETRAGEAIERDALLDRLHQLRTVLPAFATELADVRRAAAQLRSDNRRLLAEVHRLRRERERDATHREQ